MKNTISSVVISAAMLFILVSGLSGGIALSPVQSECMNVLVLVCIASAAYCFIVGELSRNNSQMDKLWSILPIAYTWITAVKSQMNPRIVIIAVLASLWGIRLTANFASKGAYSIKFWTGEEDYRWPILRKNKLLSNKFAWALFDLFFISIFQNFIVLAICLPCVAIMDINTPLSSFDYIVAALTLFFIIYELVADTQQNRFQNAKWSMIKSGKKLEELDEPYKKGFNTQGLWSRSRHPNYLAEQMIWVCVYLFTLSAGYSSNAMLCPSVFNWSAVGFAILVLVFVGSSTLSESISVSKYPEYKNYQQKVFKYLPLKKYRPL